MVGADCTGGWLNTPAGWSNRISSTMHGCPRIRHFDGYYLVGPEQTTLSPRRQPPRDEQQDELDPVPPVRAVGEPM